MGRKKIETQPSADERDQRRHHMLADLCAVELAKPDAPHRLKRAPPWVIENLAEHVLTARGVIDALTQNEEQRVADAIATERSRARLAAPKPRARKAPVRNKRSARRAALQKPPVPPATKRARSSPAELGTHSHLARTAVLDLYGQYHRSALDVPEGGFAIGQILPKVVDKMTRAQLGGALERLVEGGALVKSGRARGTKYALNVPAPKLANGAAPAEASAP